MSEDDFVKPSFTAAPKPDQWFGIRHLQCGLLFLGMIFSYSQRVNLSVSIVAMINNEAGNPNFPDYDWDEGTKGIILSSFFWGYVVTQFPGGLLTRSVGAKLLLFLCVGISSVFSILTPGGAVWGDWGLVCAFRVIQGLAQGTLFPCLHAQLSKWAPASERGFLVTFVYAGAQLSTVIAMPVCGLLATSAAGWPSTFYVFGGLGLGWSLLWLALGSNSPAEDRLISVQERAYIEDSLRTSDKPNAELDALPTPWRPLLTSLPVWAIVVAVVGGGWGFWTLMTEIPSYMNSVLGYNLQANGVLSAVPYLAMFLLSFVFSRISDHLTNKKILTRTVARKVFTGIGLFTPGVTLIGLAYASDNTLSVALLTVAVGISSATYVGFYVNHIDLAPNFAATLMGISNTVANAMGILGPLVVGAVVTDSTSAEQWRIVFFIAAVLYIFSGVFYIVFGSAELQWWNDHEKRPSVAVFTIDTEKNNISDVNIINRVNIIDNVNNINDVNSINNVTSIDEND